MPSSVMKSGKQILKVHWLYRICFKNDETSGDGYVSSDKVITSGLAGRYALALFNLAVEKKVLDEVEQNLNVLAALYQENDEFRTLVASPVLGQSEQVKAVAHVAKILGLNAVVENFLGVLATNRRLQKLASMIKEFGKLASHARGEISAEVVAAKALSDDQLDALKNSLKQTMGQDVIFDTRVDESLLGGLVVKIGSRMIDSSVKSKLENLKISMKGV